MSVEFLRDKNAQLLLRLKSPKYQVAFEDVSEFVNSLQVVQVVLNRIISQNKGGDADPTLLQGIKETILKYESKLEEMEKKGRLIRMLTNNRLRQQMDRLNSSLCLQVTILEEEIDELRKANGTDRAASLSEYSNPSVKQAAGDLIWRELFGQAFVVRWEDFANAIRQRIALSEEDEATIQDILDHAKTSSINRYKFSEFLKGFGPFESCVQNAVSMVNQSWFYGYLSWEESKKLLELENVGTFLVRFSHSKPGSFVIHYVGIATDASEGFSPYGEMPAPRGKREGIKLTGLNTLDLNNTPATSQKVLSVLIESCDGSFKVREKGQERIFATFGELMAHYSSVLAKPFVTNLMKESWFHGDLKSDEVEELFQDEKPGTFLIRFSSQAGCFALSFVAMNGKFGKALISKVPGGFEVGNEVYPTLQDMVKAYIANGFVKTPFQPTEATEVKRILALANRRKDKIWSKPYMPIPNAQEISAAVAASNSKIRIPAGLKGSLERGAVVSASPPRIPPKPSSPVVAEIAEELKSPNSGRKVTPPPRPPKPTVNLQQQ